MAEIRHQIQLTSERLDSSAFETRSFARATDVGLHDPNTAKAGIPGVQRAVPPIAPARLPIVLSSHLCRLSANRSCFTRHEHRELLLQDPRYRVLCCPKCRSKSDAVSRVAYRRGPPRFSKSISLSTWSCSEVHERCMSKAFPRDLQARFSTLTFTRNDRSRTQR
jgi:hypothetical protein